MLVPHRNRKRGYGYGEADNGQAGRAVQEPRLHLRGLRNLRRPGQHLGLLAPWAWSTRTTSSAPGGSKFVQENAPTTPGVDCAILMNREVWVASGHVGGFNDPLMDCKACKARFRADKLIEDFCAAHGEGEPADGWTQRTAGNLHRRARHSPAPCAAKKDFTGIRQFNLMFKTHPGRRRRIPRCRALPAPGDRAGHLRQFPQRHAHHAQEAARRHLPDRQVLPQRDHPRQLHLPRARVRADGAGVLQPARARTWSGSPTGAPSAATGCSPWA